MSPKISTTVFIFLIGLAVRSQTNQVDLKLLEHLKNKQLVLTEGTDYQNLQFQFVYDQKTKTLNLKNIQGKYYDLTFKSATHTLKTVKGKDLIFVGTAVGTDKDGEFRFSSEISATFYEPDRTENITTECKLKGTDNNMSKFIYGWSDLKTAVPAQAIASKQGSSQHSGAATTIENESLLLAYLRDKAFKSSTGTEVKIGYSSEGNTYGVMINNKLMFFNLSYTFVTKYLAVVKGESLTDNGLVRIYVDSKNNTLKNGETVYYFRE